MTPLHRAWTDGVIQGLREHAWRDCGVLMVGYPRTELCERLHDAIGKAESVWADDTDDGIRLMKWDPAKARYEEVPQ